MQCHISLFKAIVITFVTTCTRDINYKNISSKIFIRIHGFFYIYVKSRKIQSKFQSFRSKS